MFSWIDWDNLKYLLEYDKYDPLMFSSSLFLFLFFFVLIFYRVFSFSKAARVAILLIFSFYFYYKAAGFLLAAIIGSSIINYFLGLLIGASSNSLKKKIILIFAVTINIAALIYFKYTNFFIDIVNSYREQHFDALSIILPVGISFYTFKVISYLVDIYWENIEPERNFFDFALYVSFFANVLAGPIDRAKVFLPQVKKEPLIGRKEIGLAVFLIISGLIKKAIIADYIGINFVDRVFEAPLRFTGTENLLAIYGYAIQIYCDFSGYTDMALGIALLLGFRLMINFNSPYSAVSIADFWRRWHISLSTWLLDYLFKPLQIKFRNLRQYGNALALLITFLICGFWHGASWTFIFWGFLHGFFMVFSLFTSKSKNKLYKKLKINSSLLRVIQIVITFHLIAFSWVFFRAASFTDAMNMFSQITGYLHPEVFTQFIEGYTTVFVLIVLGFIIHYLPGSLTGKAEEFFARVPVGVQAASIALIIWIVVQFKAAELQPFIYFQF
jgi:alginate O-acetyltransferase complex protein AlgI